MVGSADDDVPSVPGDVAAAVGESAVVAGAVVGDTGDVTGAGDEPVHPASARAAAAPTAASRATEDLPA
jgi:hypothetical protein